MAVAHQEFLKAHKSSNDTIFLALQLQSHDITSKLV